MASFASMEAEWTNYHISADTFVRLICVCPNFNHCEASLCEAGLFEALFCEAGLKQKKFMTVLYEVKFFETVLYEVKLF